MLRGVITDRKVKSNISQDILQKKLRSSLRQLQLKEDKSDNNERTTLRAHNINRAD